MHGTRGSHRDADFKSGELVKGWPSPVASAIWRQDTPKWLIRKPSPSFASKPSKPRSIPAPGLFRPAIHATAKKAGTHRVPQISGIGIGSGPPQK